MTERRARVGALELVYETIGDPADAPMLLVMGLGLQLTPSALLGRLLHRCRYRTRCSAASC